MVKNPNSYMMVKEIMEKIQKFKALYASNQELSIYMSADGNSGQLMVLNPDTEYGSTFSFGPNNPNPNRLYVHESEVRK